MCFFFYKNFWKRRQPLGHSSLSFVSFTKHRFHCEWNTKHSLQRLNQDIQWSWLEVTITDCPTTALCGTCFIYSTTGWGCYKTVLFPLKCSAVLKLEKSCWRQICELEHTISESWPLLLSRRVSSHQCASQKWRLSFPITQLCVCTGAMFVYFVL